MNIDEVILGVDTHLNLHVGALISNSGKCLGTLSVTTDTAGYLKLLAWARSFGPLHRAGVEGTGTYGAGLARSLRENEVQVLEVNRPDRATRRSRGKSDPTDAENAARAVLSGIATAVPKFLRSNQGLQKRCVRYPLPGVARSRLRLKRSINCELS
jgi:transposase